MDYQGKTTSVAIPKTKAECQHLFSVASVRDISPSAECHLTASAAATVSLMHFFHRVIDASAGGIWGFHPVMNSCFY